MDKRRRIPDVLRKYHETPRLLVCIDALQFRENYPHVQMDYLLKRKISDQLDFFIKNRFTVNGDERGLWIEIFPNHDGEFYDIEEKKVIQRIKLMLHRVEEYRKAFDLPLSELLENRFLLASLAQKIAYQPEKLSDTLTSCLQTAFGKTEKYDYAVDVTNRVEKYIKYKKKKEDDEDEDYYFDEDEFRKLAYKPKAHTLTEFEDLYLSREIKKQLDGFLLRFEHREELKENNLPCGNRILLAGPPGNGKTALAGALAKKMNLPIYFFDSSQIRASHIGEMGKNIATVFKGLPHACPDGNCILFMDEIDSMATKRLYKQGGDKEDAAALNVILTKLDQVSENTIVIAATNMPDELDEAFSRRFNLHLWLPPPNPPEIKDFVVKYCKKHDISLSAEEHREIGTLNGKPWAKVKEFCQNVHVSRIVGENIAAISTDWVGKEKEAPKRKIGFC